MCTNSIEVKRLNSFVTKGSTGFELKGATGSSNSIKHFIRLMDFD